MNSAEPSEIDLGTISRPLDVPTARLESCIGRMVAWLENFGETSQDLYDFYACPYGRWAKRKYYQGGVIGKVLVAPLVAMESFVPSLRSLFWGKTRFALADAHYAMGYTYLYEANQRSDYLARAKHFLEVL